jgi:hypothetical protein
LLIEIVVSFFAAAAAIPDKGTFRSGVARLGGRLPTP